MRSFGYVMSASVHTTISPRASCVPILRTVPDPPLRWNARTRMFGNRGSASRSLARVWSVEKSSTATSSYVYPLWSMASQMRSTSAMTWSCSL